MKRLALAVLLSGCGGGGLGSLLNQTLGPDCTSTPEPADALAVVGHATTVHFAIRTVCTRSTVPRDSTVEVSVIGPAGEKVESQTSAIAHAQVFQNEVLVTFVPSSPGSWKVSAVFPGVGEAHAALRAVEPRVEPARVATWDEIRRCNFFTFTSHGTLSCISRPTWNGPVELRSQRGDKLTGKALATTGDTLWWLTKEGVLERRVDDGATWAVTHKLAVPGASGPLAVDGDDVWFPDGTALLTKAHPEPDGTLSLTWLARPEKTEVSALAAGPGGLMIWSESSGSTGPTMTGISPTGKATFRSMAAPNGWGFLMGVDGDTLWVGRRNALRSEMLGFSPSADGIREVSTPVSRESAFGGPEAMLAAFHRPHSVGPHLSNDQLELLTGKNVQLRPATLVPRIEAGAIALDAFLVGDDYFDVGIVSRDHAFAVSKDGNSLKVIARP